MTAHTSSYLNAALEAFAAAYSRSWRAGFLGSSPCTQSVAGPQKVVVADVNGDGKPDLIVGHDGFSVFLGKGDGTFTSSRDFGCQNPGSTTEGLAVADFNNDGNLDVAVIDPSHSSLTIWLGDGSGGFTASTTLAGTFSGPIVSADFDLDGDADIAAKTSGNEVVVYYGNGSDGFSAPITVTSSVMVSGGPSLGVLAISDLNGDSTPDLIFTGPADTSKVGDVANALDMFLSSRNRTFSNAGFVAPLDAAVNDIAVADVNGDDKPDVILVGTGGLLLIRQ